MAHCTYCGEPLDAGAAQCDLCGRLSEVQAVATRKRAGEVLNQQPVALKSLDIPFLDLVWFFVKAGLAAVPATVLLTLIVSGILGFVLGLFRAL